MRLRPLFALGLCLTLSLAGCGDDRDPFDPDREPVAIYDCELDYTGALIAGHIRSAEKRSDLVREARTALSVRLRAAEHRARVDVVDDDHLRVYVALDDPAKAKDLVPLIETLGILEFRIEIYPRPWFEARAKSNNEEIAARADIWPDTPAAFEALKKKRIAAILAARKAGREYLWPEPDVRLVAAVGKADSEDPADWHVLEVPDWPLGNEMVENPRVAQDMAGRPVVLYDVANALQNVLGDWTEANIGMPMAILLDGEYFSAPIIQDRLVTHVQITLGAGSRATLEAEAAALTLALAHTPMRIRAKVTKVTPRREPK